MGTGSTVPSALTVLTVTYHVGPNALKLSISLKELRLLGPWLSNEKNERESEVRCRKIGLCFLSPFLSR